MTDFDEFERDELVEIKGLAKTMEDIPGPKYVRRQREGGFVVSDNPNARCDVPIHLLADVLALDAAREEAAQWDEKCRELEEVQRDRDRWRRNWEDAACRHDADGPPLYSMVLERAEEAERQRDEAVEMLLLLAEHYHKTSAKIDHFRPFEKCEIDWCQRARELVARVKVE